MTKTPKRKSKLKVAEETPRRRLQPPPRERNRSSRFRQSAGAAGESALGDGHARAAKKAHETSVAIMEYWLGRITKQEMAARLKMPRSELGNCPSRQSRVWWRGYSSNPRPAHRGEPGTWA